MDTPLVSIIIAVFNTEKYLEECLDSVKNQTYRNIEIICVNDGSTDRSLSILKKYEVADRRFIVLSQKNSGSSAARNFALSHVHGKFVMVLDSDDFISENCIECACTKFLESDVDAVINKSYYIDKERNINRYYDPRLDVDEITGKEALIYSINWRIHSRVLWKTSILKEVGFNTNGIFGDEYTNHLLFSKCKKLTFSNGCYYYRMNPDSVTKKISINYFDIVKKLEMLKDLLIENGVYNESKIIFEPLQYNWVKSLQKYYIYNKRKFRRKEQIYAIKEIKRLFNSLNIEFLKEYYLLNKSIFSYLFFFIKMSNYRLFSLLTNLILRIYGK